MEGREHLLQAARMRLFSTSTAYWRGKVVTIVFNLLSRAKEMGCFESDFLLNKLRSLDIYRYEFKYCWIYDAFREKNKISDYYRGRAQRLLGFDTNHALKLLERSAAEGFAPAMIEMSNFGPVEDRDMIQSRCLDWESFVRLQKKVTF